MHIISYSSTHTNKKPDCNEQKVVILKLFVFEFWDAKQPKL